MIHGFLNLLNKNKMCFTRRKKKERENKKRKKYAKVYPEPNHTNLSTEEFSKECICCHHCKQIFNLGSEEIKIHCAGCDKFFHCGIAGKCRGMNCNLPTMLGEKHHLSWCINCVPSVEGNEEKKNGIGWCICKECNL